MSFCVSTLPYGFKRRLHELARPYEVLQIQEASESCANGFCPRPFRRRFRRDASVTIEFKDGALKARDGNANGADYVVCERQLTLQGLTAEHFASDAICWPKLVLRPRIVTISYCELSPEFMAQMASLIQSTAKEVSFRNCTGTVDFEALFKAFPNVDELKIVGGFAKTWAADIPKHQKCSLKSLELEGDFKDGKKLFEFVDFEQLVSAQEPRLMMTLRPLDGSADAIREMLSQGDCPDLNFDDPEAKSIYVSGSYDHKNHFLYC